VRGTSMGSGRVGSILPKSDQEADLPARYYFGLGRVASIFPKTNQENRPSIAVLQPSKKWLLRREGRQSRRQGVEMKSDWPFDKPRSNYWLRVAASNLASQSPCLAGVTKSHCNPQRDFLRYLGRLLVSESVSTNGPNRPNSQTWHRLAVWTVGALVAGIRSKTRV